MDVISKSRAFTLDVPYDIVLPAGYDESRRYPLVTTLHGMAQEPATIRAALKPLLERPYVWLLPRGPYPLEVRGREGMRIGYAWYMFDGDQARLRLSMDESIKHLLAVVDSVWNSTRIDLGKSALVGFSQGGYLAGVLGARNPMRFRGVACIAGRFKHEFLGDVAARSGKRVALAQFHGGRDELVKPAAAKEALEACHKLGFEDTQYIEDQDAGHEISPRMVERLGAWLDRIL